MMRKRIALWLVLLIVPLFFAMELSVKASEYNKESVFDDADLLTESEEEHLREHAARFERYDLSVVYVTTNDTQYKSSMVYADEFYDDNHFRTDGVLFLLDMDNREIYISTAGRCIDWLSDEALDEILDSNYHYASEGDYYSCLENIGWQTCEIVETEVNPIFRSHRAGGAVAGPILIVAVIVVIVWMVKHGSANRYTKAGTYMGSNFTIKRKDVTYRGCRDEVLHGYYRQETSSGGGITPSSSGGGFRSGGGRHVSSRGVSHGGRGRKF